MQLSIIVIFHNMRREANRTLYTLSRSYQRGVSPIEYEVLAVDNGSSKPLDPRVVERFGENFKYHYHDTCSPSPVEAVNLSAAKVTGKIIAVIVDGARMASPGLVRQSMRAMRLGPSAFVASPAWHLGPDIQPRSIQRGYDQKTEDAMLADLDWKKDGYRLFGSSTLAPSSREGFLGTFPVECSWFSMCRSQFERMGGFDERFQSPGGGMCNHDFRNRAVTRIGSLSVLLLGEGVFHQVHGGCATNSMPGHRPHQHFLEEYEAIKKAPFVSSEPVELVYFGSMGKLARKHLMPLT